MICSMVCSSYYAIWSSLFTPKFMVINIYFVEISQNRTLASQLRMHCKHFVLITVWNWYCLVRQKFQPGHKYHSLPYHSPCLSIRPYALSLAKETLEGHFGENWCGLQMFIFFRRQQCYNLFGCETLANRAITAQHCDYFVFLAVHKDHLPHHQPWTPGIGVVSHHNEKS